MPSRWMARILRQSVVVDASGRIGPAKLAWVGGEHDGEGLGQLTDRSPLLPHTVIVALSPPAEAGI